MTTASEGRVLEALKSIGDFLSKEQGDDMERFFTTFRYPNGDVKDRAHPHLKEYIAEEELIFEGGIWWYEIMPDIRIDIRIALYSYVYKVPLAMVGQVWSTCSYARTPNCMLHLQIEHGSKAIGDKKLLRLGNEIMNSVKTDSRRILSDEQVAEIVELAKAGASQTELAKRFGVARMTIHRALRRAAAREEEEESLKV